MSKEAMKLVLEALEAADWYINQLEITLYSADDAGTHEDRLKVQQAITVMRLEIDALNMASKPALAEQPAQQGCMRCNTPKKCALYGCSPLTWPSEKPAQQEPVAWPAGLIERIKAAEQRIQDGHAPRRIPADPTDVDLVLAEVRYLLEGKQPPFWVSTPPPAQRTWVDPNDKTQKQYLPHIGEPVLFCHKGATYTGKHTGGSFQSEVTNQYFNTWECHWMYLPAAHGIKENT